MRKLIVLIVALCMVVVNVSDAASTVSHDVMHQRLLETGRLGDGGRLVIGDYSVALFWSDENTGPNAQDIVDAKDSAAIYAWFDNQSPIIADHCNQGFDVIRSCKVGDTCYIVTDDSYQTYRCVMVDDGAVNEQTDMYLSDGTNFSRDNDPGYLYMYTCNAVGDHYHITVVQWALIKPHLEDR